MTGNHNLAPKVVDPEFDARAEMAPIDQVADVLTYIERLDTKETAPDPDRAAVPAAI